MNVAEVLRAGRNVRAEFPDGILVYSHAAHRSHFRMAASRILAVIPRELGAAEASIAYLYRLAWTGLRRGGVEAGRDVAVVGLGAIGECAVELAVKFGSRCLAVSDHANARSSAQQIGAVGISRDDAEASFSSSSPSEDERFDLVLVTTNSWRDWQIALSLARFGAIISVIGFPGRGQGSPSVNPLLPSLFYDRQLSIMSAGLAGSGAGAGREDPAVLKRDIVQILNWISEGELKPSRLRMGVHPASDLAGAYRRLKAPDRGVGTLLLDWKEA
jgi:threonine dehydrogenase-like Zn-dependent dehydrogenase